MDQAFQAFFRRAQVPGATAGYPKRRGQGYDSFTYTQSGFQVADGKLRLSKIGSLKIRLHRPVVGVVKTCTVRRVGAKWFACILCERAPEPLPVSEEAVGADMGLTHFLTLSNGEMVSNPRFFRRDEKALAQVQRTKKARRAAARIHERIRNRRHDFAHQTARRLVARYGLIAVEKLTVCNMVRNHCLAKSISDAAWALFRLVLARKAEAAGRRMVEVNPAYTSQACSGCGRRVPKTLSERRHLCPACGLMLDRDVNAAQNILVLGRQTGQDNRVCLANSAAYVQH